MIRIVIGNDSCLISEEQLRWFKTLETSYQYLTESSDSNNEFSTIYIPNIIANQQIDIGQFNELVNCYQTQIRINVIDYRRPRSILEHYLYGILDDVNGQARRVLDFILDGTPNVPVDFTLYQLAFEYVGTIPSDMIDNDLTSRVVRLRSIDIYLHLFKYLDLRTLLTKISKYGTLNMLSYQFNLKPNKIACSGRVNLSTMEMNLL